MEMKSITSIQHQLHFVRYRFARVRIINIRDIDEKSIKSIECHSAKIFFNLNFDAGQINFAILFTHDEHILINFN